MLITVLISINLFYLAFAQDTIEGRWHLVGYEDNVMYQFEDNYRYSIYSLDGTFGGLEDAGGSHKSLYCRRGYYHYRFIFWNNSQLSDEFYV